MATKTNCILGKVSKKKKKERGYPETLYLGIDTNINKNKQEVRKEEIRNSNQFVRHFRSNQCCM